MVIIDPIDEHERVTRFTVDPFYQWHLSNAFDRDRGVVVDLVSYPDFSSNRWLEEAPTGHISGQMDGRLHRARIGLKQKTLRKRPGIERASSRW